MSLARRKFLKKSLLGVLSISLLPVSISYLERNQFLSVNELFNKLSFRKQLLSAAYLKGNFKLPIREGEVISRKGTIYHSQKTFCLQESNDFNPGLKDTFLTIYEKTLVDYERVISLNQMEQKAFSRMISYLQDEHKIFDSEELQKLLVPILKTEKHLISENKIDSPCTSHYGYYTAHGYCSMQVNAIGNTYKIKTKLYNFKKTETHQNSFEFQGTV